MPNKRPKKKGLFKELHIQEHVRIAVSVTLDDLRNDETKTGELDM
jgi:hypothetical protein